MKKRYKVKATLTALPAYTTDNDETPVKLDMRDVEPKLTTIVSLDWIETKMHGHVLLLI